MRSLVRHSDKNLEKIYSIFNLEKALLAGFALLLIGDFIYINILITWISGKFGGLTKIKHAIFALTFIIIGIKTMSSGLIFII